MSSLFHNFRSKTKIDDGKWHTIQVRRRKRVGFISIDGELPTKGIAKYGAISLRTNSKLWIGKLWRKFNLHRLGAKYLPNFDCLIFLGGTYVLPQGLPSAYYMGFEGCIQHILVNGKPLDMVSNIELTKVYFCHDNEI